MHVLMRKSSRFIEQDAPTWERVDLTDDGGHYGIFDGRILRVPLALQERYERALAEMVAVTAEIAASPIITRAEVLSVLANAFSGDGTAHVAASQD